MHRFLRLAALLPILAGVPSDPAAAQAPPHAWLFGTWTGGLFPVGGTLTAQQCLAQPVVIFTRDVVLRATLTSTTYFQRVIETVRASPTGQEFHFAQSAPEPSGTSVLGLDPPAPAPGFGCQNPNMLQVQKLSDNQIAFPGCNDFPYPLVRCPAH